MNASKHWPQGPNREHSSVNVTERPDLVSLNTFQVRASAALLIEVNNEEDILTLPPFKPSHDLVLGGGSNILFVDDVPGTVFLNRIDGISVSQQDDEHVWLEVGAGENWHGLVDWSISQGWFGLENLALIPGLVGAAPMQNIGAYGVEFSSALESVTAWDWKTGSWVVLNKQECQLGYRDSLFKSVEPDRYFITSVSIKLNKRFTPCLSYPGLVEALGESRETPANARAVFDAVVRLRRQKLPDPALKGNAGSFFKNPVISQDQLRDLQHAHPSISHWKMSDDAIKVSAAWMIEKCGLKGLEAEGAAVSRQHSLVLLNNNASGAAIWQLAERVQDTVNREFGILLEPEPRIYRSPIGDS